MTDWNPRPIRAVCTPTEQRDPSEEAEVAFRYVDIGGIDRAHKRITGSALLLGAEAPSRARKVIRTDDVIVSTVRPNLNAVAMVPVELDGQIASTGFCVLRANTELVEPRYLFYRAISPDFVRALSARVRGASYPAVSDQDVMDMKIPIPAPSEQRQVVAILDHAERLCRLRAEADVKANRILPALFRTMFGDPNRPTLSTAPIPEFVDCLDHKRIPVRESDRLGRTGDIPYYGANGLVGYIDEPIFDEPLVLLAEDGGYWGPAEQSAYRIQGPSWVNNHAHVLRCKEGFDPDYIVWSLNLLDLRRFISGTTRGKLTRAAMNVVELPIADPCMQSTFGKHARSQTRLSVERQRVERRLRSSFTNLLHSAFTGSLTSRWRKVHTPELLLEMQRRASVPV